MAENYSLSWQAFPEHLQLMLRELFESEKFSDLTLVSDDQTQFRAHQSVLSVSSPVLQRIIENCPSQHPLIYLRGIQSQEIQAVLQFIYTGEAEVSQERMGQFIRVANDLEVKEISDNLPILGEEQETDKTLEDIDVEDKDTTTGTDGKEGDNDDVFREKEGENDDTTQSLKVHIQSIHEGVRYIVYMSSGHH